MVKNKETTERNCIGFNCYKEGEPTDHFQVSEPKKFANVMDILIKAGIVNKW